MLVLYKTIISAAQLADNLHDSNWLILDCRGQLSSSKESYSRFVESHIPNAYYCSFSENNTPDSIDERSIPYDTKAVSQISLASIAEYGFNPSSQIVIYDNDNNSFIDALWLQLRSLGFQNVAVLQGGLESWIEKGFNLTICKMSAKNNISRKFDNTI